MKLLEFVHKVSLNPDEQWKLVFYTFQLSDESIYYSDKLKEERESLLKAETDSTSLVQSIASVKRIERKFLLLSFLEKSFMY